MKIASIALYVLDKILGGIALLLWAITGLTAIAIMFIFLFIAYVSFRPVDTATVSISDSQQTTVTLPDSQTVVRLEVWAGLNDEKWKLIVTTPRGSMERDLWHAPISNPRINLYVTPDDRLVALTDGGGDATFALGSTSAPKRGQDERSVIDSERWTYEGAFRRPPGGDWRFLTVAELPECFAMLGAGSSPYRIEHHAESFCP